MLIVHHINKAKILNKTTKVNKVYDYEYVIYFK